MQLIRGLHNIRAEHNGCVLSIGNFDGVHLGHVALLEELKKAAANYNLPSLVILFEPQPNEYFSKNPSVGRLMKLREKLLALKRHNIERVLCIRFDENFSKMTASQFVTDILVKQLGTRFIVVGDDFHFGYKREGNISLLEQLGGLHGFKTKMMQSVRLKEERISSSLIRDYLAQGNMNKACQLLGNSYTMMGRVIHGDKKGRMLGFPTANILVARKFAPISGVFVVRAYGIDEKPIEGVANIGTRPTVDGTRLLLEVHFLDFNRMIYGKHIEVEFLHKLRDEQKFSSLEELQHYISQDVAHAKKYFDSIYSA